MIDNVVQPDPADRRAPNSVFLVHGRHEAARDQLAIFLRSLGLDILSWRRGAELTGRASPPTLDIVRAGIEAASCVVVLLTGDDLAKLPPHFGEEEEERLQPRPNVIFEAGWALATAGAARTLLVALETVDLMSDVEGLNYLTLDNGPRSRREFIGRLRAAGCEPDDSGDEWLDPATGGDFKLALADINLAELKPEEDSSRAPAEIGGLFTPYVIDSALALELNHSTLYRDMAAAIRNGDPLDLKHHYVGTRMAENWIGVCEEESYGHHLLTRVTADAIEAIAAATELSGPVNFVSLGPGNGKSDVAILDRLQQQVELGTYFLVDISLDLLQSAVGAVMKAPTLRSDEHNFRMAAIFADFEQNLSSVEPFLVRDETPNVYGLTGYTLGNSPEYRVIEALRRLMRPQDLLLVDARLHGAGELDSDRSLSAELEERLRAPYSSDAVRRFAFGPVEVASDFAVRHGDIELGHEIHVERTTHVPNGIDVALGCSGLQEIEAFRSSPLGHDGSFRLPTLRRRRRWLQLASVTYYDFDSLGHWFENRGFDVAWCQQHQEVGLYALRAAAESGG